MAAMYGVVLALLSPSYPAKYRITCNHADVDLNAVIDTTDIGSVPVDCRATESIVPLIVP
jgi:hypothetical protein